MHQPYRPVPNSQVKKISLNISQKRWSINVSLPGLAVLPSVFLHSTPSFDLSFRWIEDRSVQLSEWELNPHQPQLDLTCPRTTQNDVGAPEDSCLYLSATEEKLIASDNSNGSFLAHEHANKKKLQKLAWKATFLGN